MKTRVLYNTEGGSEITSGRWTLVPNCPECGTLIDLDADELEEGEIISCPECAVELEVVNIHPLVLDVIDEEEEEEEGDDDKDLPEEEEGQGEDDEEEGENGYH